MCYNICVKLDLDEGGFLYVGILFRLITINIIIFGAKSLWGRFCAFFCEKRISMLVAKFHVRCG